MATWVLGSSNQEKIRLYDEASEADILAWQNSSGDVAHAWSRNPDATYAEAGSPQEGKRHAPPDGERDSSKARKKTHPAL
jgi:hypothetical protein